MTAQQIGTLAQRGASPQSLPSVSYNLAGSDRVNVQIATIRCALMAPMAVSYPHPLKRTSSVAQFDEPAAKKLNRGHVRHHKASWDPHRQHRYNATVLNGEDVQFLLTRSIGLALEAVGFKAATPEALDSFRGDVEEYMAHYLADVRQSMLSCRRTAPIPQDFLQALHTHQLSLRSLIPHLDPPVPPERSQFPLETEPPQENEHQQLKFLGPVLNSAPDERARAYVPKHFPEFPSKHTYRATAEFPDREVDPRKVRERATEESRMGEEALRRLVSSSNTKPAHERHQNQRSQSMRARRDQMFMETMAAVTEGLAADEMDVDAGLDYVGKGKQKEPNSSGMTFGSERLHSAVNSEKRYWRKPIPQREGGDDGS